MKDTTLCIKEIFSIVVFILVVMVPVSVLAVVGDYNSYLLVVALQKKTDVIKQRSSLMLKLRKCSSKWENDFKNTQIDR